MSLISKNAAESPDNTLMACFTLLKENSKELTHFEDTYHSYNQGEGFGFSASSYRTGVTEGYLQKNADEFIFPNEDNIDVTDVDSCLEAFKTVNIHADYVWTS